MSYDFHHTHNIYLSTSWNNPKHNEILNLLRAEGHIVYDFKNPNGMRSLFSWKDLNINVEQCTPYDLVSSLHRPQASHQYIPDILNLKKSDIYLLLLPAGNSSHIEMGYAYGLGKSIVIFSGIYLKPELFYSMADFITGDLSNLLDYLGRPL
jgi:hypothetical protein